MKRFLILFLVLIVVGCTSTNSEKTVTEDIKDVTVAEALCGNSILESGEQCDDGNKITEPCNVYGKTCEICNSQCRKQIVSGPFCGDNIINGEEQCDDGNVFNDDTCPTTCILNVCGNGVKETGENCDISCVKNSKAIIPKYYPNEAKVEGGFSFKFDDTCASECGTDECSGTICTDMTWDRGRDPKSKGFATLEVGAFKFQPDNTIVPMVRGITKKTNYLDYCKTDKILVEYYCGGEKLIDEEITCDNGCTDGKCI